MKSLFLRALEDKEEGLFPIWIMRQAGRYLPAYQKLRKKHSLLQLFKKPKLASEVMLLPFQELSLDAAILFSDITLALEHMGCEVDFIENRGPQVFVDRQTRGSFSYIQEIIERARPNLQVPIIGFCGGPFTTFCYFLNDRHPFKKTKIFLRENPKKAKEILEKITESCFFFLQAQIEKSVAAVQIFESHLDILSDSMWEEFCFPFLKKLCREIASPLFIYAPSSLSKMDKIVSLNPSVISIDSKQALREYRSKIPLSIALQGNFAVEDLFSPFPEMETRIEKMLSPMQKEPGYIVNLGQGIWPDVPFSHVKHFVGSVKKYALKNSFSRKDTFLSGRV